MPEPRRAQAAGSLAAFLAMAFVVSALAGIFATYAAPAPYARALHLETEIDAAEGKGEDALGTLAARLAADRDFACPQDSGTSGVAETAARLRACVRERGAREAEAEANRLRWLIALANLTAAAFVIGLSGTRRG